MNNRSADRRANRPARFAVESLNGTAHELMIQPARPAARSFRPVQVPSGQFFVLGDNRDNSGDSRRFGLVNRDAIVGRASAVAYSLDHDRTYAPRWSRTLRDLD